MACEMDDGSQNDSYPGMESRMCCQLPLNGGAKFGLAFQVKLAVCELCSQREVLVTGVHFSQGQRET